MQNYSSTKFSLQNLEDCFRELFQRLLDDLPYDKARQFLSLVRDELPDIEFAEWLTRIISEAPSYLGSNAVVDAMRFYRNTIVDSLSPEDQIILLSQLREVLPILDDHLDQIQKTIAISQKIMKELEHVRPMPIKNPRIGNLPDLFSYHFYPVGQGLFASGSIHKAGEASPRYQWVYDCGSLTSQKLIDSAIRHLISWSGMRKRLDLVTLSHFDRDHISGICRLIKRCRIGTLMLPYMPLAQRLVVAFEEGVPRGGALSTFFINPVEYITSLGGPGIDRILFILPSGGEGPPIPDGPPVEPNWGDDPPSMDFQEEKPVDSEDFEALLDAGKNVRVQFLKKGSAIKIRGLWEFVPYNDDSEKEIPQDFKKKVVEERDNLLQKTATKQRNDSLARLKRIYDRQFGDSPEERNIISLFLYAGPIYSSWRQTFLLPYEWYLFRSSLRESFRMPLIDPHRFRCSALYSGDGYLDTEERLNRLINFLNKIRIQRTGVFQVMHHGAEGNWHKGVATAVSPLISVFSSDPARKAWGHPHAAVLREFWPYGPKQADASTSVTIGGQLVPN